MEELIAKRYVKALREVADLEELKEIYTYLNALSLLFKDWRAKEILVSPEVKTEQKLALLIDPIKEQVNPKLINFLKILAQKGRLGLIPAIAKELKDLIAYMEKRFEGRVYSEFELSKEELKKIEEALAKRVGGTVVLAQAPQKFDGIKVEVDTVGIEIEFSKSKIKKQLIEEILKAI
ncbi:MAG: ATP synthase F1 subunit delta [Epsilonproteobacteria bacterium]|nr:ATP synthase F1 subunit delta [Campylobacterota bacterium]NPA64547.1 F0F1 ATP synthase subunit delta [Campylobacterota bacterium]